MFCTFSDLKWNSFPVPATYKMFQICEQMRLENFILGFNVVIMSSVQHLHVIPSREPISDLNSKHGELLTSSLVIQYFQQPWKYCNRLPAWKLLFTWPAIPFVGAWKEQKSLASVLCRALYGQDRRMYRLLILARVKRSGFWWGGEMLCRERGAIVGSVDHSCGMVLFQCYQGAIELWGCLPGTVGDSAVSILMFVLRIVCESLDVSHSLPRQWISRVIAWADKLTKAIRLLQERNRYFCVKVTGLHWCHDFASVRQISSTVQASAQCARSPAVSFFACSVVFPQDNNAGRVTCASFSSCVTRHNAMLQMV